jgi:hypothetical protein
MIIGATIITIYFSNYLIVYIERFNTGSDSGIDAILTGRYSIWIEYLTEITQNVNTLVFGRGVGVITSSHNLYISTLYIFGFLGTILFLMFISLYYYEYIYKYKNKSKKFSNFVPLLIVLIYFFTLDGLYELYFFPQLALLFSVIIYNNVKKTDKNTIQNNCSNI